jgi:hypothetical protein
MNPEAGVFEGSAYLGLRFDTTRVLRAGRTVDLTPN